MVHATAFLRRLRERVSDRGASLVEYALLIALIAIVAIAAMRFFGDNMSESFSSSGDSLFGTVLSGFVL